MIEDRIRTRGGSSAAVDSRGLLSAVTACVPLESLAKGIVLSEIFANGHIEALKAQAVTARGEILAKVGARQIGDPYLLCAETQHFARCFAAPPVSMRERAPAVDATCGEALFAPGGGALVPSYYSAICGGQVRGGQRQGLGRPPQPFDSRPAGLSAAARHGAVRGGNRRGAAAALARRRCAVVLPHGVHGEGRQVPLDLKSFTQAEVDAITAAFNVGSITQLDIDGRGISGRARTLVMRGASGEARVHTELSIRRLFRMLPSGMFVIEPEGARRARGSGASGVVAGGHGAGMCQTGAIGRAEQGEDYRKILKTYFSGAEVVRMYG